MRKNKQIDELPPTNLSDHCKVENHVLSTLEREQLISFNTRENKLGFVSRGVKKEIDQVDVLVALDKLKQLKVDSPKKEYLYLANDWVGGYGFNRSSPSNWKVDVMISKRGSEHDIFQIELELKTTVALMIQSFFNGFFLGSCFIDHRITKAERETIQRKIKMLELKMEIEIRCKSCESFVTDDSLVICQNCRAPLYDTSLLKNLFLT